MPMPSPSKNMMAAFQGMKPKGGTIGGRPGNSQFGTSHNPNMNGGSIRRPPEGRGNMFGVNKPKKQKKGMFGR